MAESQQPIITAKSYCSLMCNKKLSTTIYCRNELRYANYKKARLWCRLPYREFNFTTGITQIKYPELISHEKEKAICTSLSDKQP